MENREGELWKDIKDYEGYYQISNHGRVKSLAREVPHSTFGKMKVRERILRLSVTSKDYQQLLVSLKKENEKETFSVSILVARHFLENKEDKRLVFHRNDNLTDNHVTNLFLGDGDTLSDRVSQGHTNKGRINNFRGVSKVIVIRYLMNIRIKGKNYRHTFSSEEEAAKKYDFYIEKYNLNRKGNYVNNDE